MRCVALRGVVSRRIVPCLFCCCSSLLGIVTDVLLVMCLLCGGKKGHLASVPNPKKPSVLTDEVPYKIFISNTVTTNAKGISLIAKNIGKKK